MLQSDAEAASIAGINGIRLHSLNILVRLAARDAYVDIPRTSRALANSMRGGERPLLAGFCPSLVSLKFPRSGHCLSDGVATTTNEGF